MNELKPGDEIVIGGERYRVKSAELVTSFVQKTGKDFSYVQVIVELIGADVDRHFFSRRDPKRGRR